MRENLTYGLMRRARGPRPNDRDSKVENPEQTMVTALETCPLLYVVSITVQCESEYPCFEIRLSPP